MKSQAHTRVSLAEMHATERGGAGPEPVRQTEQTLSRANEGEGALSPRYLAHEKEGDPFPSQPVISIMSRQMPVPEGAFCSSTILLPITRRGPALSAHLPFSDPLEPAI